MGLQSLTAAMQSLLRSVFCGLSSMSHATDVQLGRLLLPYAPPVMSVSPRFDILLLENMWLGGDMRLYDCTVSEIRLYKSRGFSSHEYFTVKVTYLDRHIGTLRIERTVDPTSASSLSITSTTSSPGYVARDEVTLYSLDQQSTISHQADEIAFYIPDHIIPFSAIIAACLEVTKKQPLYHLLTTQCYWYAGVIIRLMIGDGRKLQQSKYTKRKPGEWQSFVKVMTDKKMIEAAHGLVQGYQDKITSLVSAGNARTANTRCAGLEIGWMTKATVLEQGAEQENTSAQAVQRRSSY
ncbi:hypothetical protein C8Q72DRAFT_825826 [Fomitopsis betulina]|nr:hypothetical protein C8Q72DRAFT_825826 [Fomitopsis betulina]